MRRGNTDERRSSIVVNESIHDGLALNATEMGENTTKENEN